MTTHSATASFHRGGRDAKASNIVLRVLGGIGTFFAELARAAEANALYHRLEVLSDESLADMGLKREDLPRYAFEKIFEDRR